MQEEQINETINKHFKKFGIKCMKKFVLLEVNNMVPKCPSELGKTVWLQYCNTMIIIILNIFSNLLLHLSVFVLILGGSPFHLTHFQE